MAGIAGQGTTFNLPNYVGELFTVTPTDTPFLSSIGGLSGGESVESIFYQWQGYDLRSPEEFRQRLEGANAPSAENRVRFNVTNVVEIHQESVEVSYTKLAAAGQFATTGSGHPGAVGIAGTNPVTAEMDWQIDQQLVQIARDIEVSFISGVFANPSTNASPRRTRGLLEAVATNVVSAGTPDTEGTATITASTDLFTITAHGMANGTLVTVSNLTGGAVGVLSPHGTYYVISSTANTFQLSYTKGGPAILFSVDGGADVFSMGANNALVETEILDLLQLVWENGGIQVSDTATLMCNASIKRLLTHIFITKKNYQESSRDVGGVHVMTIETDFGTLNVMLNRHMPASTLAVVSLEQCSPVFLQVPGKGFLFVEPLAQQGAAERAQIYGEIGLKYGNEKAHGKLTNINPAILPA